MRIVILLSLILFGCVAILYMLVAQANMPNLKQNGFLRVWLSSSVLPLNQKKIKLNLTRIVGHTDNHTYFTNEIGNLVFVIDNNLKIIDTFYLQLSDNIQLTNTDVLVDSPWLHIVEKNSSFYILANLNTFKVDHIKLQTPIITRTSIVPSQFLFIRGLDTSRTKQIFKKVNAKSGIIEKEVNFLKDRGDGGFSDDGILIFDNKFKLLIYTLLYQNMFLAIDSNFQLQYIGKTIDTFNVNTAVIKAIESKGSIKFTPVKSRLTINSGCWALNGFLFVHSGLRSDNQTFSDFKKCILIDVYAIYNGKYIGSFRIPSEEHQKILDIAFLNNFIVVLYKGGQISTYKVDLFDLFK